jgi:hypothetical protein
VVQERPAHPAAKKAASLEELLRPRRCREDAVSLTSSDQWFYELPDGNWKQVLPDIIHWYDSAPGGQPTLFVFQGVETRFYPPQGWCMARHWQSAPK